MNLHTKMDLTTEAVKNAIEIDDVKLQKECLKNIQFLAKTTAEKLQ